MANKKAPLIVISGPSGSGKTTICREMAARFNLGFSVSHTTRPRRENEVHGRDYFFVSTDEFERMRQDGEFLEWAKVYDHCYGTSKKTVEAIRARGQGVVFDVDTQGALAIKKILPEAVLIFIITPGIEELRRRLKARGRDSEAEIEKRVKNAKNEMTHRERYDFVVVNDKLKRALKEVEGIIDLLIR